MRLTKLIVIFISLVICLGGYLLICNEGQTGPKTTISRDRAIEIAKDYLDKGKDTKEIIKTPQKPHKIKVTKCQLIYDPVKKEYIQPIMKEPDEVEARLVNRGGWRIILTYNLGKKLPFIAEFEIDAKNGKIAYYKGGIGEW